MAGAAEAAVTNAITALSASTHESDRLLAAAIQGLATGLQVTNTNLTSHIQDNTRDQNALTGVLEQLRGINAELQQETATLKQELATLRTQHDGLQQALTERFTPLEARATALEAQWSAAQGQLASSSRVAALETQVQQLLQDASAQQGATSPNVADLAQQVHQYMLTSWDHSTHLEPGGEPPLHSSV